jgi:hypothetical protein
MPVMVALGDATVAMKTVEGEADSVATAEKVDIDIFIARRYQKESWCDTDPK